ncbi:MAG: cytochrome c3 family protein [Polyangiales bacterium]
MRSLHRAGIGSLAAALTLLGCGRREHPRARALVTADASVTVAARSGSTPTFPCMARCHTARTPDPRRRVMQAFHVGKVLRHGPTLAWCDRCHDPRDLDRLRLLSGDPVSFDDASTLCGQCHAEKHQDWSRGVHGVQTGSWLHARVRRSCVACHDPHDPHRPRFEALPRPLLHPHDERRESR